MSLLGFLGSVATGFLTGGPAGAIAGGIAGSGILKPGATRAPDASAPTSSIARLVQQVTTQRTPMAAPRPAINVVSTQPFAAGPGMPVLKALPQGIPALPRPDSTVTRGGLTIPGLVQAGGSTTTYYSPQQPAAQNGACPKGHHLNKTGYYSRRAGGWVAAGTVCVKNRRRNPLNPRALSRSISRISSAKNAAKFLSRVTVREGGCGCK